MITAVNRQPWIGADYESGGAFRKRIMIIADLSDQLPDTSDVFGATISAVHEQLQHRHTRPFWRVLVFALTGHAASREARVGVLQSIAVYDYAQSGHTVPGTRQHSAADNDAVLFRQATTTLAPAVVFVLGYRLWNRLPPPDSDGPRIAGAPFDRTRRYRTRPDQKPALAFCMRRPTSSGYGPMWHHFAAEVMRQE